MVKNMYDTVESTAKALFVKYPRLRLISMSLYPDGLTGFIHMRNGECHMFFDAADLESKLKQHRGARYKQHWGTI